MGDKLANALGMIGGQIAGPLYGLAMEGHNDRRQLDQQKALMMEQMKNQKEMMKFQNMESMKMWEATGYGAQVDQMKRAGLNPALIYGMGGGGGQSAQSASAGQVQGGNAAAVSNESMQGLGMGMQMALMNAQRKNIEADTKNKEVDAANKQEGGVDYNNKTADTLNKTQGTLNAQAQKELMELEIKLKGKTLEDQATIINQQMEQMMRKTVIDDVNASNTQETAEEQAELIKQELAGKLLQNAAIQSGIDVNNAKIKEIVAGIQQKWKELSLTETRNEWEHNDRLKAIEEYTTNALKVAGIMVAGNVVRDIMSIATRKAPKGMFKEKTNTKGETSFEDIQYR